MAHYSSGHSVATAQLGRRAHPDTLADAIAYSIESLIIRSDPHARFDLNVRLAPENNYITGQISSSAIGSQAEGRASELSPHQLADFKDGISQLVRRMISDAGYTEEQGFNYGERSTIFDLRPQSPDISDSVNGGGAGDTVIQHGYATNETLSYLPLVRVKLKEVRDALDYAFHQGKIKGLGPDGKLNLGIAYGGFEPEFASYLVIAALHHPGINVGQFRDDIVQTVVLPALGELYKEGKTNLVINGAALNYNDGKLKSSLNGKHLFEHGGFAIDSGVNGEKVADATYGDIARRTGGGDSAKDPTKADKQTRYMARMLAKSVAASNPSLSSVEVRFGYGIGHEDPLVLSFDVSGVINPDNSLEQLVRKRFPLSPKGIIKELDLRNPRVYELMADDVLHPELPWEQINII